MNTSRDLSGWVGGWLGWCLLLFHISLIYPCLNLWITSTFLMYLIIYLFLFLFSCQYFNAIAEGVLIAQHTQGHLGVPQEEPGSAAGENESWNSLLASLPNLAWSNVNIWMTGFHFPSPDMSRKRYRTLRYVFLLRRQFFYFLTPTALIANTFVILARCCAYCQRVYSKVQTQSGLLGLS